MAHDTGKEDPLTPVLESQPKRLATGFTANQWQMPEAEPLDCSEFLFPQAGRTSLEREKGPCHVVRSFLKVLQVLSSCQSAKNDLIGVFSFFSYVLLSDQAEGKEETGGSACAGVGPVMKL